jgi:hypothetical protein
MGAREPGGGFPVGVYERGSWYPQPTVGPCTGLGIGWPIQLLANVKKCQGSGPHEYQPRREDLA